MIKSQRFATVGRELGAARSGTGTGRRELGEGLWVGVLRRSGYYPDNLYPLTVTCTSYLTDTRMEECCLKMVIDLTVDPDTHTRSTQM